MSMRRLRIFALIIAAVVVVLAAVGVTQAAVNGHATKRVKHPKAAKKVHGLRAPSLLTPANGAHVQQMPALTWSAVNGAVEYQFQVAADPRFHSLIVVSASAGKGIPTTDNLAAALEKPVTDGTYYWRVRGVSAAKRPGPWSATRKLVKAWTDAPQLLGPAEGTEIKWPSTPLVLHWSEVPYAYEYIVTIATDEGLANIVVGSATSPVKTDATAYAPPGTLQAGQTYYWGITPVDAEGHRGTLSRVGKFSWSWPTTTATSITPLNAQPEEIALNWTPEFTWNPIPGAARYEVQVSSAEGFPTGSLWCCSSSTLGTTASPTLALANNNDYYWRVRAVDADGNTGVWNEGPRFTKAFDDTTPTIPNLEMVDVHETATPTDPTTETPIVQWSPVPGAASYEVQVAPYEGGSCRAAKTFETSSLSWTPLTSGAKIGQATWPNTRIGSGVTQGDSYCVQVAARSDVDAFGKQIVGAQTKLGEPGQPAFKLESRFTRCKHAAEDEKREEEDIENGEFAEAELEREAAEAIYNTYEFLNKGKCNALNSAMMAYVLPATNPPQVHTPLFTWEPAFGAKAYYVVIARDPSFTEVVEVATTEATAYAPPLGGEEPLSDETSSYYWSVIPYYGTPLFEAQDDAQNSHKTFNKSSIPPTPLSPVGGVEVSTQPTFKWSPAEGALNYTLQVATNPTFASPIDNVKTDSTSYTSSSTYPAHETLYWRVRANDTNTHREGLNWSAVQTFKRTLPAPEWLASNPTGGEAIPVLAFTPAAGAVGYDIHVEQPGGTTKDFTSRSPVFTASGWDGPGIWRFSARAEFPTAGTTTVPGGYFYPQPFAHTVAPPAGAVGVKSGSRIVISWNPQAYAKEYEVAISTDETFSTTIETHKIDQTSWAPSKVDLTKAANKGTLYWRVAAVDNKGNVGPYATGSFVPPKPKCVEKKVKKGKKTVKECVAPKHKPAKTKKKRG
jgi:hypothetical protein